MFARFLTLIAILMAVHVSSALSDEYPSRPIRILVGLPAGGGVDIVARQLAEELSLKLGQRVLVENRVGAGGNIAAAEAAKSPPDG